MQFLIELPGGGFNRFPIRRPRGQGKVLAVTLQRCGTIIQVLVLDHRAVEQGRTERRVLQGCQIEMIQRILPASALHVD